jgi:sugar phosphate isomerase/epimerase
MRTLSLAALTVLELSPVEMVRCAAEAGFSHVGLRLVPATPNEPRWPSVGDTPLMRETRAALRDTGVQVLDVEILRLRPETEVSDHVAVLETGAGLGARHVLVAGNDPDEARTVDLAELAAPLGLTIALEPMPWTDVRDFVQGLRIVEATRRANVGVLIDPLHFDRAGNRPEQLHGVAAARLPYLQFCDAPAERPATLEGLLHQARAERQLPGEGGLDLAGLLRAAPAGVPLSVELPMALPLPAIERARRARAATVDWLERHGLAA